MSILLPLLDERTLVIDSTSLETFKTCPTMYLHTCVNKRVRNAPAPARDFGHALHAALELRYKEARAGEPSADLTTRMEQAVQAEFAGIELPLEEWRTPARCIETVRTYNDTWHAEPFEVLGVEVPFAVPVGTVDGVGVVWSGRIDLLIRWEGAIFCMDHKTMSAWGSGKATEFENSAQFKGYAYAVQALHKLHGAPFPEQVHGFALNAIVNRKPTTSARATLPRTELHRARTFYSQARLEEWRDDMLEWVWTLLTYAKRGYMPMNTKHCASFFGGNCPFLDVCTSPREQRAMVLASDLYRDNDWDPITRGNGTEEPT